MDSSARLLRIAAQIGLGNEEIAERKRFLEFDEGDIAVLKGLHAELASGSEQFVEAFYEHMWQFPSLKAIIGDETLMTRLKETQSRYFESLTEGEYEDEYVLGRLEVGVVHQRIGLAPNWYIGAYRKYLAGLIELLAKTKPGDTEGLAVAVNALLKVVMFDVCLALDAYFHFEHQRLRESEERFRSLTDLSSDFVWEQDEHFRYTFRTSSASKDGIASEDFIGKTRWELPITGLSEEAWAAHRALLTAHQPFIDLEYQVRGKDGITRWHSTSGIPIFDSQGEFKGYRGIGKDISKTKAAEEALRLRERAIEASSNGIIMIKASRQEDNPIIYANPAFERMSGYSEEEVIGRNSRFLFGDDLSQPEIERLREATRKGTEAQVVVKNYQKGGTPYWISLSAAPVHDGEGRLTHFINVFNDVTERVNYEAELERQANHDSLTGLANRNLLNDRLEHAMALAERHGKTVAVIFIDLDHFKDVNDSLGHAVGDQLLKDVAIAVSGCVRDVDTIARAGGDEFVLILAEAESENDVMIAMGRVLSAVSGQYTVAGHELHVGCSIGASLYPRDGKDAGTLLRNADAAMYRAKEGGRNRFLFYQEEMNARLGQRLSLETKLRHALERQEMLLHYQPQIALRTGAIVGMEALLRWEHSELGLVSPAQFIGIAEDTGLIVPIGEWVLNTACAQARAWREAGLPRVRMAVNISARQFRHQGLEDSIRRALEGNRLEPDLLEIEITESMAMHDPEETIRLLEKIKAIGLRIALDDFGTGFSSLNYLKRFPIDVLKIDQSFVRGIVTDRSDAAIARTVIGLARSLYLQITAEGVETAEQAGLLHAWTCDDAQGYHFSRPLAAEEATSLLKERKRFDIQEYKRL